MSLSVSRNIYKQISTSNPISPNIFCADPCAIEYNGRLYVYGTNDQQQYREEGVFGKNTYEKITSIVCFSSDDLINWTFHGEINVKKIAPWILNAWSPSIIVRQEEDGLDHFYFYFSNNGCGVGVLTSTSPLGPWSDPLGQAIVSFDMKTLKNCPNPFDPGVCLDKNGDGWLVFGAGIASDHDEYYPGTSKIVKLGKDLISLNSDFADIPAPYFFESSDLNYINDTFVYSYNNNWIERKLWNYPSEKPTACSMSYMISKNPLDSDSWQYKNHYFKNPGEQGLNYSNNHTCLVKFGGTWYILYHTLTLQENTPATGGFRSICIDKAAVDEEKLNIELSPGTRRGLEKIKNFSPLEWISGTCMSTSAEIDFIAYENPSEVKSVSKAKGSWFLVKNVDFDNQKKEKKVESSESALIKPDKTIEIYVEIASEQNQTEMENAFIELRLDKLSKEPAAIVELNNSECKNLTVKTVNLEVSGVHDLYFIFSDANICLNKWKISR